MTYRILNTDVVSPEAHEVYPQVVRVTGDVFDVDSDAGLTDVLTQASVSTPGLLLSDAFAQLLAEYDVDGEVRPVTVVHHGETHPYVWYATDDSRERDVDFERSVFAVKRRDAPATHVDIRDRDAFDSLRGELIETLAGDLRVERLRFAPRTPVRDLFYLRLTDRLYVASERLAQRLETSGLTGFELGSPIEVEFP